MKDQVFGVLQRIGRSIMLPDRAASGGGLLLGIGGSFSNVTMLKAYGLTRIMGPGTFWNALFMVMSRAGDIVFTIPDPLCHGCCDRDGKEGEGKLQR